jgi:hypothetical protein
MISTLLKITLIAVAAVALDNQTGVISKLAGNIPFLRDLVLPTVNKD